MRILSVTHVLHLLKLQVKGAGEIGLAAVFLYASQIIGDSAIIMGRVFKGLDRQIKTGASLNASLFDFINNPAIVFRVDHNGHKGMVFGGGADHGGAANIDIFDGIGQAAVFFGNRGFKGVEIHHHQINGGNIIFCHYRFICAPASQNTAMNFWMQGFDPPVHDLRKACVLGNFLDRHAIIRQQFGRAAGGENFNTRCRQCLAQLQNTGFVGYAKKCPANRRGVITHNQCPEMVKI